MPSHFSMMHVRVNHAVNACALPFHCWTYSTCECTSLWLSTPRQMDRGLVSISWQLWIKPLQTFGSRFLCEYMFSFPWINIWAWDCRVLRLVLTFATHGQPLCQSASWEWLGTRAAHHLAVSGFRSGPSPQCLWRGFGFWWHRWGPESSQLLLFHL